MTEKEYDAYQQSYEKNKSELLSKGGLINKRYRSKEHIYGLSLKNISTLSLDHISTKTVYLFDLHLEDLGNGIAPESPGIGSYSSPKIDQRALDRRTLSGGD